MRAAFLFLVILFSGSLSYASTDCSAPSLHAMSVVQCHFGLLIGNRSNLEVEKARKDLISQGFSDASNSEFPLAVFIRGTSDRYTYLVTTDVSRTGEMKTIAAVISAKIDSLATDREIRVERVFTSDSL